MQHGEIPGSLHFERPNPLIPWGEFPVQVPTRTVPWPGEGDRKIAGISAFGFSGTNVHLVVESAPPPAVPDCWPSPDEMVHVVPISAKSSAALTDLVRSYQAMFSEHPGESLADYAYSAGTGRSHFGHRLAVVGRSTDEAGAQLAAFLASPGLLPDGVETGDCRTEPQLAWLFPGEHDATLRGAETHYSRDDAFRRAWNDCGAAANGSLDEMVPAWSQRAGAAWDELLNSPVTATPTLFVHQYCLSEMWKALGAAPAIVWGRGAGAYAAAVAAGVVSLEDGLRLAAADGRARESGNEERFRSAIAEVEFHERRLPLITDVTGVLAGPDISTAKYWIDRFARKTAAEMGTSQPFSGATIAVEFGRRGSFAGEMLTMASVASLASSAGGDDWSTVMRGLAKLYVHGATIHWDRIHAGRPRQTRDLPTYPFQRVRCWLDAGDASPLGPRHAMKKRTAGKHHPLLGVAWDSAAEERVFELQATPGSDGLWHDHCIYGQPILPATGYVEMAIAAACRFTGDSLSQWEVADLTIERALRLPVRAARATGDAAVTVETVLSPSDAGWSFRVFSRRDGEAQWTRHATAQLRRAEEDMAHPEVPLADLQATCSQTISLEQHYADFEKTGLEDGPRFRALRQLFRGRGETLAEIRLPESARADFGEYLVHPILLDAALQGLAAVIPHSGTYLPVGVERLRVLAPLETRLWCHAKLTEGSATSRVLAANVTLCDDGGRVKCILEGVQFREVSREALGLADGDARRGRERREPSMSNNGESGNGSPMTNVPNNGQRPADSVGVEPYLGERLATSVRGRTDFLSQWQAAGVVDRPQILALFLRRQLAEVLGLDPSLPVASDEGFFDLGMDSLTSVEFANRLQESLACDVAATVAYDYPTLDRLSEFLMNNVLPTPNDARHATPLPQATPRQAPGPSESSVGEGIAIIGMSCRFPGCDTGPEAYWKFLLDGGDAICDVPPQRWDASRLTDPNPDAPGKMTSAKGGFLRQPLDQFDAAFFGISPREARSLDPQQRLLLEATCEAFEDAGLAIDKLDKANAGVFLGIAGSDYLMQMARNRDAIDAYFGTGTTHSTAAGRIWNTFGLQGPALSVDTACSSALVAIHLACQSLRNRECDVAVAAGVNLVMAPEVCINFSKARMLSADGHCKSFDASANGYVRGEGVGVLLLKPLAKAQAHGDRILAVIRGTAINQDGRSGGLTVPSGPAQEAVLKHALEAAGVSPDEIDYLEAHGTGTALGDPIELGAIGGVFRPRRERPLIVGSVKANIGHLETASGIAGLIKVILALRHGQIPRQLHFETPNPKVDWSELPIEIPVATRPWPVGLRKRIAGVSAFGFSGTNAHVIVEEAPQPEASPPALASDEAIERPMHLLVLSAKSPAALKELARSYIARLAERRDDEFADLCHTAASGRAHFPYRLAVYGGGAADVKERLERHLAGASDSQVHSGTAGDPPQLAFLFTGQGSQYVGMGRTLFETQPTFRRVMERCDALLRPHRSKSLLSVMFSESHNGLLDQTVYTQPALYALEAALCEMWRSWGVAPSFVLGHSVGEYAAAHAAGVVTLEDGLSLIAQRARLIQSLPSGGGMLAVMAHEDQVKPYVARRPETSFAAINGPRQVVLSGPIPALEQLASELTAAGVVNKRLVVSHAFHSTLMEPILDEFQSAAAKVAFASPKIPVVNNVTGRMVTEQSHGDELRTADYWRRHLRSPVQFTRSIEELAKSSCDGFLEIGPQPTLIGMARQCVNDDRRIALPSLKPKTSDWETVLSTLAQLYVRGANIDWVGFDRDYRRRRIGLPTYPFQRIRHWPDWLTPDNISSDLVAKSAVLAATAETSESRANKSSASNLANAAELASGHPLLGGRLQLAGEQLAFQVELSSDGPAYLADHCVFGRPLFPAAGYVETALAAGHQLPGSDPVVVEDVELIEGLPLPSGAKTVVQVVLDGAGAERRLRYFSRGVNSAAGDPWVLHATAKLRRGDLPSAAHVNLDALRQRCHRVIDVPTFYAEFQKVGLSYGPSFQGVTALKGGGGEAIGELRMSGSLKAQAGAYFLHPALLDAALQVIAAATDELTGSYLPVGLEALRFYGRLPSDAVCHVRLRDPDATDAPQLLADIKLLDPAGAALAVLTGLRLKRVNLPSAKAPDKAPAAQRSDWLHEFVWRAKALAKDKGATVVQGTWLIFADDSDVGALLSRQLQSRGARCVLVQPGREYRQLHGDQFELNTLDVESFRRLLNDACGSRQPRLEGAVFLWGLSRPAASSDDCLTALGGACGGALHLVQSLLKTEHRPQVCLVTRGGQSVTGQEPVIPEATAEWGLARVIALEHPDLHCRRIDLDPSSDEATSAQQLVEELLHGDDEDQLAYRNGARW